MKILGIGANQFNSRDGIIVEGCKSILNINHFDRYITINDFTTQNISEFYTDEKFDLIIYCGTPWLWDQMQHSPKYKNVLTVKEAHPEAKMVWLGIGSSLYISDINSSILRNSTDQEMLRNTFQNDLVMVRDSLAHEILNKAGVENHFLPCPSYFFKPVCQTSKECDVIFYHAPKTGISAGYWDEKKIEEYRDIFREFYKIYYHAEIAVCEPSEIQIVQNVFKKTPILLKDPIDTFHMCKGARTVLSSRIHNAVPAMVYGAEVGIVPVDSRVKVLTDFFDVEVNNPGDLHKIKQVDITRLTSTNIEIYRKLLKEFVNG